MVVGRPPLLPAVEELNVAVLHVLLVLLHGSPGIAVRGKPHVSLPTGPAGIH